MDKDYHCHLLLGLIKGIITEHVVTVHFFKKHTEIQEIIIIEILLKKKE